MGTLETYGFISVSKTSRIYHGKLLFRYIINQINIEKVQDANTF